jgi:uncharacterized RDD family membrane protein YckC
MGDFVYLQSIKERMNQNMPPAPIGDMLDTEDVFLQDVTYAGFWLRLFAYLIDTIIIRVGLYLVWTIVGVNTPQNVIESPMEAAGLFSIIALTEVFATMVYAALFVSGSWQATPGKRAVGIKVTNMIGKPISFGNALGREAAKFLSAMIIGIGFLLAAFTERKQALHDMIAGCLVVKQ